MVEDVVEAEDVGAVVVEDDKWLLVLLLIAIKLFPAY